jgi:hypothetical protein
MKLFEWKRNSNGKWQLYYVTSALKGMPHVCKYITRQLKLDLTTERNKEIQKLYEQSKREEDLENQTISRKKVKWPKTTKSLDTLNAEKLACEKLRKLAQRIENKDWKYPLK